MQKWEYKVVSIYEYVERELNRLGAEGWELITLAFTDSGSPQYFYFKRLKG